MQKNLLLVFVFILIVITASFMFDQTVNALSTFLQTDKMFHVKGDIILVYGSVGNYIPNMNTTIQILDNKNNLLLNSITTPKDDGTFLVRIPTNNTNWKTGGPYKISVQYGTCCHVGESTFTFYADQLPPLKQTEMGTTFWNVTCNSGLVKIMKQEDGFIACVNPSNLQKLVSQNWGYDPSEKLTTYGLKDVYHVGQEIDFKIRLQTLGNRCELPLITVKNSDQKIIWQDTQGATNCGTNLKTYTSQEVYLGTDKNAIGLLTIKQPGAYSMTISWFDGNITKEFTVIQ